MVAAIAQHLIHCLRLVDLQKCLTGERRALQALTPAVDDWRRRITGLASRFERLKGHSPGDMPALVEAQQNMDAAEQHVQGAQEASQQARCTCCAGQHLRTMPYRKVAA